MHTCKFVCVHIPLSRYTNVTIDTFRFVLRDIIQTHAHKTHEHKRTHTQASFMRMDECVHSHIGNGRPLAPRFIWTYSRTHMYIYTWIHIHVYTDICVHIYTYIHKYTHIHVHIGSVYIHICHVYMSIHYIHISGYAYIGIHTSI
jgi:hypothetical protein